jgi:hypothetical protein
LAQFVVWQSDAIQMSATLVASNSAAATVNWNALALDGTTVGGISQNLPNASVGSNMAIACAIEAAEGFHYMTVMVKVSAGTGTWYFTAGERGLIFGSINI